jgi:hypothetical protein
MTRLWPEGEAVETWGVTPSGMRGPVPSEARGTPDAPAGFVWRGVPHPIVRVCNRWRVHTRWWESGQTVCRAYLKVVTGDGLLCMLYHDLQGGGWFLSRLYD